MIDLYTAPTPNGWKVSILLEEAEIPYSVRPIDLGKQGQANVFFRYAPEQIPFAIERYQKETRRLY
jgi:GST-like protein